MKIGKCYVCNSIGPTHSHHIWMQSSGGKNGPTVDLDASCHQKLHQQALNINSKSKKIMLFSPKHWVKAKPLVEYIVLALRKNRDNPDFDNPAMLQVKLRKKDIFYLHLMKTEANYTNLQEYVKDLLKSFIKHKFPTQT